MDFEITFEDEYLGTLSKTEIEYFAYFCSLLRITASCKLLLKNIDTLKINKLKVGTPFTVKFYGEEESYENKMKIFSIDKKESSGLVEYIKILAISPLFFDKNESTQAYEGSVSQIVNTMLKKELKDIKSTEIETTEDIGRIRYRISEEPLDFLTRILKYGNIGNNPVYIYFDAKGKFNLKGVESLKSSNPRYISIPFLADKENIKIEQEDSIQKITMMSYSLGTNKESKISKVNSIFTTELFKSPDDIETEVTSNSVQENNASVYTPYPTRTDYYDWYVCPNDAKSIAVKRNFEELGVFQILQATYSGFLIKELDLGLLHYFVLPYTPTEKSSNGADVNSGEGLYMVRDTMYIFENGVTRTNATLLQVGY